MSCSHNDYIWFPFVGLSLGAILTLAFLSQVVHRFTSIIQLHSTISSYCSDPRGFGNRFLICLTFLVAYNHIGLLIQEQMIKGDKGWNDIYFYLQVSADFLLPLVGIFYTSGHGMVNNKVYELGPWFQIPIVYSETIHSVSALGWMCVTIGLNLIYGFESSNHVYTTFALISVFIFVTFVGLQAIIEFFGVEVQYVYECPDCDNALPLLSRLTESLKLTDSTCRRCLREPGCPQSVLTTFHEGITPFQTDLNIQKDVSNPPRSVESYIKRSSYLFAWSFVFESLTVLSASALTYAGSVIRIQHGC